MPSSIPNPCTIEGQQDIYGMGVRIGLYVQWYSTALAYLYIPQDATQLMVMNYIISIAVAIAALVHRTDIYHHELYIVLLLLIMPTSLFLVRLLDYGLFVVLKPDPRRAEPHPAHETRLGSRPNSDRQGRRPSPAQIDPHPNRYGRVELGGDIARLLAAVFLASVTVYQTFSGGRVARHAPGCQPKLLSSHYLSGAYSTVLKVSSLGILVCILVSMVSFAILRRALSKDEEANAVRVPRLRFR